MRPLIYLASGSLLLAALLTSLKLGCEHWAAPRSSGIQGALAASPVDVLLIGSSHTRQSYDLRALESGAHVSAFAVAYNALDYRGMAVLVPALLERPERRPRILVIEGYGMSLVRTGGLQDSRLFFDAPPRLKLTLMAQYLDGAPSARKYFDLFDLAVNRDNELLLLHPVHSRLTERISYRGGYADKVVAGLRDFAGLRLDLPRGAADPRQVAALRELIAFTRRQGVRVICCESPMPGPVERQEVVRGLKDELTGLMQEEHVPYYDGAVDFPIEDPRYFADSNHLSTAGRALYTERVARFIRATQAGRETALNP